MAKKTTRKKKTTTVRKTSRRGKVHRFAAQIEAGRGGGAAVRIPFDVREQYGTGGRVKVKATFDGEPYRGSLAPMGGGVHCLGVLEVIREKIGKGPGDTVRVELREDTEPRVVKVPPELAAAFRKSAGAKKRFDALSYSHQREHVEYVTEAKKPETRVRRSGKVVEMLIGD